MNPRTAFFLAVLTLLAGCTRPAHDPAKLKAIKAEAELLIARHPVGRNLVWVSIPRSQWPPVIASLKPDFVVVETWGVDINVKPYFDGGWGYEIPRSKNNLPKPAGCYSEPSPGVFWYGPC